MSENAGIDTGDHDSGTPEVLESAEQGTSADDKPEDAETPSDSQSAARDERPEWNVTTMGPIRDRDREKYRVTGEK